MTLLLVTQIMFIISFVLSNREHAGSAELISLLILEHIVLFPHQIISAEFWSVACDQSSSFQFQICT